MKIYLDTMFSFGKYKGKNFKWILMNDKNYLQFLFRKRFQFCPNCFYLITKDFEVKEEFVFDLKTKTSKMIIFKKKTIVIPAEKFIRKKDFIVVVSKDHFKTIDIQKIPFELIKKKSIKNHFDSSAFQQDDRFFQSEHLTIQKKFDQEMIEEIFKKEISC